MGKGEDTEWKSLCWWEPEAWGRGWGRNRDRVRVADGATPGTAAWGGGGGARPRAPHLPPPLSPRSISHRGLPFAERSWRLEIEGAWAWVVSEVSLWGRERGRPGTRPREQRMNQHAALWVELHAPPRFNKNGLCRPKPQFPRM